MRLFRFFTMLAFLTSFNQSAYSESKIKMSGFSRKPNSETHEIKAYVDRYVEHEDSYNVALFKHNAFYVLPKKANHNVKEFLENAKLSKKEYIWVVDPFNRRIYEIRD